jgi:hypothetical protein
MIGCRRGPLGRTDAIKAAVSDRGHHGTVGSPTCPGRIEGVHRGHRVLDGHCVQLV